MIEVKNLIYEFTPGHRTINDVSFRLSMGSVSALIGANGSGKSTLLECMAGVRKPTSGSISISGKDIYTEPGEFKKMTAYLPDQFGLYENLTVFQILSHQADAHFIPKTKKKEQIDLMIEQLHLQNIINERVIGLSTRVRKRLAIAKVMIHSPKLVILDDPMTGLDTETRSSLFKWFKELNINEGVTFFFTTYQLGELYDISQRLLVLKDGILVQDISHKQKEKHVSFVAHNKIEEIPSILSKFPLVTDILTHEHMISFSFAGDINEQTEILSTLITNGVKISEFTASKN